MAQFLELENLKLRREIKELQSALHEIGREVSYDKPRKDYEKLHRRRERLKREIAEKVNKGIYEPPKSPELYEKPKKFEENFENEEDSDYLKSYESDRTLKEDELKRNDSLQLEFLKLKASVEQINQSIENLQENSLRKSSKKLKDSFGSYYSDEKGELENDEVIVDTKTSKRLVNVLCQEIEALRAENSELKLQMRKVSKSPKRKRIEEKKPMKFNRWQSATRGSLKSPMKIKDTTLVFECAQNRLHNCSACDLLLSHGYSTKCCSSHGITCKNFQK
ncbi:unnamed protein product [Blepharisma stoltei]|uniref:Uncharacterized protein n=1 Tax=Blepharisma stoltei TaxID=1481888 RepID=A0AAU9JRT4_9CILI|nr:unnamed protein product [Blepharisma stoltei]